MRISEKLLLCLLAIAIFPSGNLTIIAAGEKIPVPDEKAREKAKGLLQKAYGERIEHADSPESKAKLATLLLEDAKNAVSPENMFVLLVGATNMAAQGGDVRNTFMAIEGLQIFDFDYLDLMDQAVKKLILKATPSYQTTIALKCLETIPDAIDRDRYELGRKFASYAITAARKSKNMKVARKAVAIKPTLKRLSDRYDKVKVAIEQLKKEPDDLSANLAVGKFKCFVKQHWAAGLPLLAKCGEEPYMTIAKLDLSAPIETMKQNELADKWWELSEDHSELEKYNIRTRAAVWYGKAIADLSGMLKRIAVDRYEKHKDAIDILKSKNDIKPGAFKVKWINQTPEPATCLFGQQTKANNIVYVIDRSGSMIGTFDKVQREIIKSINQLSNTQYFHVVFFSDGQIEEFGSHRLVSATNLNKRNAILYIKKIKPLGQAKAIPAIERAFRVLRGTRKKGYLMYLLTDGRFDDGRKLLNTLEILNSNHKVRIFTYLFGNRPPSAVKIMKTIAEEHNGKYCYVSSESQ